MVCGDQEFIFLKQALILMAMLMLFLSCFKIKKVESNQRKLFLALVNTGKFVTLQPDKYKRPPL